MVVQSLRLNPGQISQPDGLRRAGTPITFATCAGFLHPAAGNVGVLMVSPWGFEELTIRKSWRVLAEMMAAQGFPCMRFDLPGTGDSLERELDILNLEQWLEPIRQAAQQLRQQTHVQRMIIVAQGMGVLLAQQVADQIGTEAFVAMAPMAEGRSGIRELALWGKMIAEVHNVPVEMGPNVGVNVAGYMLAEPLTDQIKKLRLNNEIPSTMRKALVVARPNRATDADATASFRARGVETAEISYTGYDELVSDPTRSETPLWAFENIVEWLVSQYPDRATAMAIQPQSFAAPLAGPGFDEEPICFGDSGRIFGVLTRPQHADSCPVVVLPNSGYNPHTGWARGHVNLARKLAQEGIASFRMDGANIGDGEADPNSPSQALYAPSQVGEVSQAIDVLSARGFGPVVLAGRCSGAYLSLHAAQEDTRVAGVVAINALRLVWDPREGAVNTKVQGFRSLESYKARMFSHETFIRLITFKLPLWRVGKNALARIFRRFAIKIAPLAGDLTIMGSLHKMAGRMFADFNQQGVKVSLIYAEGDGGLDELALYCGPRGRKLAGHSNVQVSVVPNADHNMTSTQAQNVVRQKIIEMVEQISPVSTC